MNSEVSVRSLRRRLAEQIKSEDMERSEQQDTPQASAPADLLRSGMVSITPDTGELSQRGSERGQVSVWFWWSYYDKWRPFPPRIPRKTPNIFYLGEVYALGLADDRKFVTRVLLLVSGSLLKFLGNCLRGAMQLCSV